MNIRNVLLAASVAIFMTSPTMADDDLGGNAMAVASLYLADKHCDVDFRSLVKEGTEKYAAAHNLSFSDSKKELLLKLKEVEDQLDYIQIMAICAEFETFYQLRNERERLRKYEQSGYIINRGFSY